MDVSTELVRCLDRGKPFRATLPTTRLTELLSSLHAAGKLPPEVVVLESSAGPDRVTVDFSGKYGSWTLS